MILDEIVANKRAELIARKRQVPMEQLRGAAEKRPAPRDFATALSGDHVALIAEIKRASPSRGTIRAQVDPVQHAWTFAAAGAAAVSVLTDEKYFGGSLDDLSSVRAKVSIPVLRKDFIIDEYQIYEARAAQADAILLIVRALSDAQLVDYAALAHSLGMMALVEVHDEKQLERALAGGAHGIGINNRNLADFSVDLAATERLAPLIAPGHLIVSESGISTRSDVRRVGRAGANAVLVGEALMRADDAEQKVRELTDVKRGLDDPS